ADGCCCLVCWRAKLRLSKRPMPHNFALRRQLNRMAGSAWTPRADPAPIPTTARLSSRAQYGYSQSLSMSQHSPSNHASSMQQPDSDTANQPLSHYVSASLDRYFDSLNGCAPPNNMYHMVLEQVEKPLL